MKGKGWRPSTGHRRCDHLSAHPGQGDRTPGALPAQVPAKPRPSHTPPPPRNPLVAVTSRGLHSPVAAATWPTMAVHSSSTNSSPSSAGRSMQPLASERGPAGAAAVSASSVLAPTSRPPRAGGRSRRRREGPPRPRPQVTRARGASGRRRRKGLGGANGSETPTERHLASLRATTCHSYLGVLWKTQGDIPWSFVAGLQRLASSHSHFDQDAWLSQVPKAAPCYTLGQGHVGKEPWPGNLET